MSLALADTGPPSVRPEQTPCPPLDPLPLERPFDSPTGCFIATPLMAEALMKYLAGWLRQHAGSEAAPEEHKTDWGKRRVTLEDGHREYVIAVRGRCGMLPGYTECHPGIPPLPGIIEQL